MDNLNTYIPDEAINYRRVKEHHAEGVNVSVYFDGLESRLIEHIKSAQAVFGCVAWLTNFSILEALTTPMTVSLVVQKEDFLRPDIEGSNFWAQKLRDKYENLQNNIERYHMPWPICEMSLCADPFFDAVRCMGNHNSDKRPAFPRMHNKFLVFADIAHRVDFQDTYYGYGIVPYAVWTGSFNFTQNSTNSLENAVFIEDKTVAQAYLNEYAHVVALSEPLDWETEWCAPEFRIGT